MCIEYDGMTDANDALNGTANGRANTRSARLRKILNGATILAACLALAACASTPTTKNKFDPKKYGVKGSPRVVSQGKPVPKGGGRYLVGKPYKIAGKWYRPKLDSDYDKVGLASWYGPTFHGRMTANGEIFDKNALTAAHPTMPLPSYARVTNLKNGRSMIVRVNDRGPFHGNRVIDLSSRVADMLDFKSSGTAKVRVQYVGRARMDGHDQQYLLASYSGPGAVSPGATMPGTMLAMAQPPAAIVGSAPLPPDRPMLTGPESFEVAFDPAQSYETADANVTLAANSGPYGTGGTFEPRIQGGAQTMMGYQSLVQPASYKTEILPPVPSSAKASFAPEHRIDAAYGVLTQMQGGVSPRQLAAIAQNRR